MEITRARKVKVQKMLLSIPAGSEEKIKVKYVKACSIRSAIRQLNQKGYFFEATERGLVDEVKVKRIK
ncbi:MAG: hypothetical protein LBN74_00550 [Prevotella sp.]|jgi:hypothetical protein|nr:hypothetical protein [Prevotella sp.]